MNMKSSPKIVSGLWIGDTLPQIAELSIKSFLDHGISFQLFTYSDYPNIPEGTIIRQADEIVSTKDVYLHDTGSYGMFSDWFRYALLEKEGGWWIDLDVICLSSDLPEASPWYACQEPGVCSPGIICFPAHHPLLTTMRKLAEDPASPMPWDDDQTLRNKEQWRRDTPDVQKRRKSVPWGYSGPDMFTLAVRHFGLEDCAALAETVYSIPYTCWRHYFNGAIPLDSPIFHRSWAVHIWGEMLRREPDAWDNLAPDSIVARLMERHGIKKKVRILVGICSCQSAFSRREGVRESWLTAPAPGVECRFFLGGEVSANEQSDTVGLDAPDSYEDLPAKVLEFFRYALKNYEFDWLFKCDDDTYLRLDRLESLCDEQYGLIGNHLLAERNSPSGGAGYLLSRDIVEKIVAMPDIPPTGAEDVIFGQLALDVGAVPLSTDRLCMDTSNYPLPDNDVVTAHWCSPDMLRRIDYFFHEQPVTMYHARHPHWEDILYFYKNGTYSRAKVKDAGQMERHNGYISMNWFRWPSEQLQERAKGYVGSPLLMRPCEGFPPLSECFPLPAEEDKSLFIQLGSSYHHLPGWLNLDLPYFNIIRILPWKDDSVDAYFLEHVIEYLSPTQAYDFFLEAWRTLKPGGVLRLALLDILRIAANTVSSSSCTQGYETEASPKQFMHTLLRSQRHQSIWSEQTLRVVLESIGFAVESRNPGESSYLHLSDLEHEKSSIGSEGHRPETVCLEAYKPLGQDNLPDQH